MSHSLGVTNSYSRFSEEEMLEDYLKGVGHLTVNQNLVMIRKNSKKQQEYMQQTFKDMEEKYKKGIDDLLFLPLFILCFP